MADRGFNGERQPCHQSVNVRFLGYESGSWKFNDPQDGYFG